MVPPRINLRGDKEAAFHLRNRALQQLAILQDQMSHQKLFRGRRVLRDNWGREIIVNITGPATVIDIFVPENIPGGEEYLPRKWAAACWCSCCFADGIILGRSSTYSYPAITTAQTSKLEESIETYGVYGDYGNWGSQITVDDFLGACANSDAALENYNGVRYLVDVCRGRSDSDKGPVAPPRKQFYCSSSDFAEYHVGDVVAVWFRGTWEGVAVVPGKCGQCGSCSEACQGANADDYTTEGAKVSGVYVIMPLAVEGLTNIEGTKSVFL